MDRPLPLLAQTIDELLDAEDFDRIARILEEEESGDVAEILNYVAADFKPRFFRFLAPEKGAEVLSRVDDPTLTALLAGLSDEEISFAVDELPSDDAADIMGQLPEEEANRVFALMEEEDQENIQNLLRYPEESAGGIMESEFVAIPGQATAAEAMAALRERSDEVEEVHNVYMVDGEGRLKGILPLWRVAISPPEMVVDRIAEVEIVSAPAGMDQEEVANLARRHDLIEIPVVDETNRLIGRITIDDVLDVLQDEATEDITRMAGTGEEEITETSVFRISLIRLPWLLIGLLGGIASAFLISGFEDQLHKVLALAFFVPVIMAMGGNVGIQCSSIVVRAIALEQMEMYRMGKRVLRELFIASLNGVILALLVGLVAFVWHGSMMLGVIVGTAMLASILVAATVGTVVPMLLHRVGFDPVLATGPFITTSNDVLNLLIYFVIATLLLAGT